MKKIKQKAKPRTKKQKPVIQDVVIRCIEIPDPAWRLREERNELRVECAKMAKEIGALAKVIEGKNTVIKRLKNGCDVREKVIFSLASMVAGNVKISDLIHKVRKGLFGLSHGLHSIDSYFVENSIREGYVEGVTEQSEDMVEDLISRDIK